MKLHFTTTTEKFTVRLNVEPDNMKLFMDVEPIGKPAVSVDELLAAIKSAVDVERIETRVIEDILSYVRNGETVEDRRILKGTPPENGADGKLVLLKKKYDGDVQVAVDNRGFANFKDLHLYDNIMVGDTVGRIYPPKPGQDGMDVFNKPVAAKAGTPVKVSVDKSISIQSSPDPTHDYQVLIAESEGYLLEDSGRLSVKGELTISGDLDMRFGSIDFVGNLKVTGDVTQGLTLKANKGITVQGSLTKASLISSEGDIHVKGFFYGGAQSIVETPKSFNATVVHGVSAETGGDIIVTKEALDCELRTRSSLLMLKGRLVGGEVSVTRGMEANFIGNDVGQKTIIRLCSDIEITREFAQLEKDLMSHEKAIKLIELKLGPFTQNPQQMEQLEKSKRAKIKDFIEKLETIKGSKLKLLEKKSAALQNSKTNDIMRVNFLSKMYRGVVVIAGESIYEPLEDLDGPKSLDFIVAQKTFELGELKPLS